MELKTKYEYTYFIYPYVIKESKYLKYLMKLLKDKNCELRIFKKDKDMDIYSFSHIELESICLEHLIIVKIRLNN